MADCCADIWQEIVDVVASSRPSVSATSARYPRFANSVPIETLVNAIASAVNTEKLWWTITNPTRLFLPPLSSIWFVECARSPEVQREVGRSDLVCPSSDIRVDAYDGFFEAYIAALQRAFVDHAVENESLLAIIDEICTDSIEDYYG